MLGPPTESRVSTPAIPKVCLFPGILIPHMSIDIMWGRKGKAPYSRECWEMLHLNNIEWVFTTARLPLAANIPT